MKFAPVAAACAALTFAATAAQAAEKPLRIVMVDVEGGAATLFVTPEGKSLLVDTGWPDGQGGPAGAPMASSAERIVAAAKKEGLAKIDWVLVSHYHLDHVGGVFDLDRRFPIGGFIDHGPNREEAPPGARVSAGHPTALYPRYEALVKGRPRKSVKAGEQMQLGSLRLDFVAADRVAIPKPLPGGGAPTPDCAGMGTKEQVGGEENPRSVGFVARFGEAKILDLSDLTWDEEAKLACPISKIGPMDVLLVSHHGSSLSNSPQLVAAAAPRVALVSNGPTKGGDKVVLETLAATPSKPPVWQLHSATRSPEADAPADQIANLAAVPDTGHPLEISVTRKGEVTVVNPRIGAARTYRR
jgi:beta-lactamase superfamily II metal-dependent hydrolase